MIALVGVVVQVLALVAVHYALLASWVSALSAVDGFPETAPDETIEGNSRRLDADILFIFYF